MRGLAHAMGAVLGHIEVRPSYYKASVGSGEAKSTITIVGSGGPFGSGIATGTIGEGRTTSDKASNYEGSGSGSGG